MGDREERRKKKLCVWKNASRARHYIRLRILYTTHSKSAANNNIKKSIQCFSYAYVLYMLYMFCVQVH